MKLFKNIIFFLFGIFISILFFELYFKVTEIKLPFKTIDVNVGKSYQSNVLIHENKENLYLGETNQYGFVGNYTLKKPDNTFRIAFFGDSFVEGFQVFEKHKFVNISEKYLNKNSKVNVEILNFSISNAVLPDIYIRKKRLAEKFDIDLFVYFLDSYDLILPSQSPLNSVELDFSTNFLKIKNVKSKSIASYYKLEPIIDNSSCFNLLLDTYFLYNRNELNEILLDKFYFKENIKHDYSYYDSIFKNLPNATTRIITDLNREKAVFIFREDINKDLKSSLQKLPNFKIPIIETKPVLDSLSRKGVRPYFWENSQTEGHFNYKANESIGKFIAKKLKPFIKK